MIGQDDPDRPSTAIARIARLNSPFSSGEMSRVWVE
jgi:hypothetical protein